MSHYTFSVYRNVIATVVVAPFALVLERKIRPRMTFSVLYKIILLALLEPVIDQNLYYVGMKYTTATFTSAMCNVLPAITFLLAWALRFERVNVRRLHSQAKIVGTIVTVGGAMIMTLVNGSVIGLPWTKTKPGSQSADDEKAHQNPVKGALMITSACFCWSIFYILQATTLKSYPAGLSLTSLICMVGALQGAVLTLVVERSNAAIWSIGWDIKLLAYVYGGIICSGVTYYVSGVIMKEKGPVFVTSFNPLNMIIVAVTSSFVLAEQLNVGK
ncbi:wat1-related protein at2g39510 [Phtheirospermum japonicum]|uniref:WAT1-related protein n=1 Tax=Phtheirospermum japonicum TaxID=374723 RepID=A0A830CSS9_9LAMI|nr:wat1-related protein at2g39510 [Phtheirospermum japonicum]